jgi:hypothetical protein
MLRIFELAQLRKMLYEDQCTTMDFIRENVVKWARPYSAGSVAIGYGPEDCGVGVRVPVGKRIFSKWARQVVGSNHPPIQWFFNRQ